MNASWQYPTPGSGDLQPVCGFHPASTSAELLAGVLYRYRNLRARGFVDDNAGPGINVDQFAAALAWVLVNLKRGKTVNRRTSTYTLKHICESEARRYISAGAMIAALVAAGYAVERCSPTSHNAWTNATHGSTRAAWKRVYGGQGAGR